MEQSVPLFISLVIGLREGNELPTHRRPSTFLQLDSVQRHELSGGLFHRPVARLSAGIQSRAVGVALQKQAGLRQKGIGQNHYPAILLPTTLPQPRNIVLSGRSSCYEKSPGSFEAAGT
jgi:hypothetical protein